MTVADVTARAVLVEDNKNIDDKGKVYIQTKPLYLSIFLTLCLLFASNMFLARWAYSQNELQDNALNSPAKNISHKQAKVQEIDRKGNIILADGQKLYLPGIVLFNSGKAHLRKFLTKNQPVRYYPLTAHQQVSLNDALAAEVELLPNFFLRDQLILSGHALMFPHYLTRAEAQRLRALEQISQQRRGTIWRKTKHPAIITPEQAENYIGQYKIIRGKIFKHEWQEKIVYLNFAADWRTDFTIRAPRTVFTEIQTALGWQENLTGKIIECRGILHQYYGAALDLSHEGQCYLEDYPADYPTDYPADE